MKITEINLKENGAKYSYKYSFENFVVKNDSWFIGSALFFKTLSKSVIWLFNSFIVCLCWVVLFLYFWISESLSSIVFLSELMELSFYFFIVFNIFILTSLNKTW